MLRVISPVAKFAYARAILTARVLAERALRILPADDPMRFRALKLAGQAEHVCGREDMALALFKEAEAAAGSEIRRRDAKWAQLMSSVALELVEAPSLFQELTRTVKPDSPEDLVRLSGRRICFDLIFGAVDSLDHAREASQLLPHVRDPFLRGPFLVRTPRRSRLTQGMRTHSRSQ